MYCQINAGGLRGLESYVALVEVDVSRGLPCFEMVGLLAGEVKEARERIRVALKNAGVQIPAGKITVNISPAGIHKGGTAYDLPVALGIMAAQGQIRPKRLEGVLVAGELGLSANVKPIRGVLPMVMAAEAAGMRECILPFENLEEGLLAGRVPVMGVGTLAEALAYLESDEANRQERRRKAERAAKSGTACNCAKKEASEEPDFGMVQGMREAKYAAATAAAGFHSLLLTGPPGAGKTMLARCIPSILPPLTGEERREVSAIYSVAGMLEQGKLLAKRPFVSPHHTVTPYALAGSGSVPRPGMVTLAHRGVLFLDEMAEFKRSTLDILRQPMEEGRIFLAKSAGTFVYPASFLLVAATNPCPCGYYPDRNRCRCSSWEVRRYLSRISGPLLDRIDLFGFVNPSGFAQLMEGAGGNKDSWDSEFLRSLVQEARERQKVRYAGTGIGLNGRLGPGETLQYCRLGMKEQDFLERLLRMQGCSARACHRILRVARTLADLEGREEIGCGHLSQAFCYRPKQEMADSMSGGTDAGRRTD